MKKLLFVIIATILLLAPLAAQTVTVTSPNGGEPWELNSSHAITWNFTNPGDLKVDIILRNTNGKVGVIKSQVALSSGSWPWQHVGQLEDGTVVPAGSDYIVRIRSGNACSDDSNHSFSITGAAPPPGPASITVTSPNGGENWGSGSTKNITWNAANWTGTVRLELWRSGVDKGDIASGIPSFPGNYPWPVGKLVSGSAGIGSGYKVRVVREYKAGTYTPIPLAQLKDESDGEFSISFLPPHDSGMDVQPIKVSSPKEGDNFTYGPYAGPNTYGIKLNIQWETPHYPPFLIELYDRVGKKLWETEVGSEMTRQKLPSTSLYSLNYLFVPENSSPGFYKIRVLSADKKQSGFSGQFRIREVKVLEETIPAGIDNHYHSESTDYSFGGLFSGGMKNNFENLPARARVGFYNRYETGTSGQYAYSGSVYRSQLTVNLDRYKNLKGKFLDADLYIERKEHHNNYKNGINLCGDKLYVLSGPWGKNNVMETPGVLLQSLSQSMIGQHIDVTNWFNAWLSGQSPNYGLLLTALSESFNHENNWCVSYFHVVFNTKFQTEE